MDNIKEEIERIKSLFTEERLYGNLISEDCDSCSETDMVDELKDKGYSVYNKSKGVTSADCDSTVSSTPHLSCVKTILDDLGLDKYQIIKWRTGCIIFLPKTSGKFELYSGQPMSLNITFFENGTFKGENKTFLIELTFDDNIDVSKFVGYMDKDRYNIKYIQIRGIYDDSCNITNLYYTRIKDGDGAHTLTYKYDPTVIKNNTDMEIGSIKELLKGIKI